MVSSLNSLGTGSTPAATPGLGSVNNSLSLGRQTVPSTPQQAKPTQLQGADLNQQNALGAMVEVLKMLKTILEALQAQEGGSAPAAGGGAPAPSPAAPAPASASPNGRLKIAEIDNFSNSNHGNEMASILQKGGGDPSLAGKVDVLKFDLAGKGTAGIASNLQNILNQVKSGAQIDAVSISQQDFNAGGSTPQVKALIDQIQAAGVPVAVAAGNGGTSQLGTTNSFNVMSNGGDSGKGNVQGQGATTSAATANLAPLLASLKASGKSISQIHAAV